jgi:hypothetical protein
MRCVECVSVYVWGGVVATRFCRDMFQTDEPDLSLAISLVNHVRDYAPANSLWHALTGPSLRVVDGKDMRMAALRLRQTSSSHPLQHINVYSSVSELLPLFLSAVAGSISLASLTSELPLDYAAVLALQLKSVRSLRSFDFKPFPAEAGLELLRSRTNWSFIRLPTTRELLARASECVAQNQSDFELIISFPIDAAHLKQCLSNPHLTSLFTCGSYTPEPSLEALTQCRNLTRLVFAILCRCSLHLLCFRTLMSCIWIRCSVAKTLSRLSCLGRTSLRPSFIWSSKL